MKMNPYHVKFPDKIYVPPCPDTIDKEGLDKDIERIFKEKK